ncbi:hypothetical protein COO60DRAFT_632550 [Scenedesmus sp. NREL 46B-D3]|nr:hypothetical protein COO60DRAFT_632550 [Scenedesmus sp. NREL 46B-D3]
MHCTAKVINGVLQGAATGVIDQRVPDCSTMDTSNLPIRQYAADILAAVATNDVVVVIGETGSGKTTQLSQILLEAGYGVHGIIGVTQPREQSQWLGVLQRSAVLS